MPGKAAWGALVALLLGCDERQRLTFGTEPDDQLGPFIRIDPPSRDTTLSEGSPFVVGVHAVDTSGVDSVFIGIDGADFSYLPIQGNGADTVTFSINIPTSGRSGQTITLGIFGVDVIGNIGATVSRQLTIE